MPYPNLAALPDGVKDALPTSAQEIWRNAFNSAEKSNPDYDEGRLAQIAWGAVKNAGWAQDSGGKWRKMAQHEFDAEVFSVGNWNGDKYSEKDLDAMVANFEKLKGRIKPPVKLGHNEDQAITDGFPSIGWVTRLRRVGKKLIATLSQVPDIIYQAIKGGRYKRVSSEIYWNLKDAGETYNRVLAAVSLLGADIPAVTNLKDLDAFLSLGEDSYEKIGAYTFDWAHIEKFQKDDEGDDDMSDEKIAAIKAEYKQKMEDLKKNLESERDGFKTKLEKYEKEQNEQEKTRLFDEIKSYCEQKVKDGKMLPAERGILIKSLEDGKHVYAQGEGFSFPFEAMRKCFDLRGEILDVREIAEDKKKEDKTYKDVYAEMDDKARKLMMDNKDIKEYSAAVVAILNADEDLAKRYSEASQTKAEES